MPKVSVIIPTHNCGRYLVESVESVLNQSLADFELIVVDDGSTDGTDKIMKPYLDDSRVKYIKKPERRGLSAARNTGIEASIGDFISFLDADDMFVEGKIQRQLDFFEDRKQCGLCYTNEVYFKEGENKHLLSPRYHFSGDVFYFLKRSNFIHISTVMVRKEILRKDRFEESLRSHEDWDFFLRLSFKDVRFLYMKEPLSKIMVRSGSMTVDTRVMDASRRNVGLKGKAYWGNLRMCMWPFGQAGVRSTLRYVKMKTKAFFIGFPGRACFNRPVPQELL